MATNGTIQMRSTDQFTWHMERDPSLRSTVVALIRLGSEPDWDVLTARIDRMSRIVPGMRQRVVDSALLPGGPRWVVDPHFDLHWHLRRVDVPVPHDDSALLELVRETAMAAFDKDRALWEFTLVQGLSDGSAALIIKIHHSLADGVGSMRLLGVLFDLAPEGDDLGKMPAEPDQAPPSWVDLAGQGMAGTVAASARLLRRGAGAAVPTAVRSVRDPLGSLRSTWSLAQSVYRTAGPMLDTLSPVMRDRAMTRYTTTLDVPLAELRGGARAGGCTINDAFLTAVTGGLRRYHHLHGAPVEALRVTMPVNLRAADDSSWGNNITLQRLILPVEIPTPLERMRAIHQVTGHVHDEPSIPITALIAGALNLLPPAYVGGMLKHVDFLASNVPGSPIPLYLAGADVSGFYAFGPTIGSALNITLISYRDTCNIGLNIDTAAVPDPGTLVECFVEAFAEVTGLAASTT